MTESFANLISALRQELEHYGEMLALLESQQQKVAARCADGVYQSIAPIKLQAQAIQKARAHREERCAELAQSLQQAKDATFAELMPLLPADCRPLLRALVEENNELLVRVRQRVRQNHLRLSRSIELMQSLINSLCPAAELSVYNGRGNMKARRHSQRSLYEAVG
jgi:flagellar biosynthesis/type III secretory pathway chaperone